MDTVQGTVLSVTHVDDVSRAVLDVDPQQICARCAAGKGCGAGVFGSGAQRRQLTARVTDGLDVREGLTVEVAMGPGGLLKTASTAYGYPLVGGLAGTAAARVAELGDTAAALAALAGLFSGFVVARRRLRQQGCLRDLQPVITAVVEASGCQR
ncbi:MAG: SoxR reducing system RseC family protein [Gammaproteobacteria bacterium]|nr:SoxR reducing system RseC family protein [Gammaproteobacteria bacterium]